MTVRNFEPKPWEPSMGLSRQRAAMVAAEPPILGPMRILFIVHDPRVRESEILAEMPYIPGEIIPSLHSSVVLGGLTWQVSHIRHFLEDRRVEVWLAPFH